MSFRLTQRRPNTLHQPEDIPGSHPRKNFKDLHRILNENYTSQKQQQQSNMSQFRPNSQKPSPQRQDITLLKQTNQQKQIFYNPQSISYTPQQKLPLKPFNPNFIPSDISQHRSLNDISMLKEEPQNRSGQKRRFSLKFNENLKKFFGQENQNSASGNILEKRSKSTAQIPQTLLNQFLTSQQQQNMSKGIFQYNQQDKDFIIQKQNNNNYKNFKDNSNVSIKYVNNLQQKQQQQKWNMFAHNILNNTLSSQQQDQSRNYQENRLKKIQQQMFAPQEKQQQPHLNCSRQDTPQKYENNNLIFMNTVNARKATPQKLFVAAGKQTQEHQHISTVFNYPNAENNIKIADMSSSRFQNYSQIYADELKNEYFQRRTKPNPLVINVKDVSSENQIKIRKDLGIMNLRSSLYQLQK